MITARQVAPTKRATPPHTHGVKGRFYGVQLRPKYKGFSRKLIRSNRHNANNNSSAPSPLQNGHQSLHSATRGACPVDHQHKRRARATPYLKNDDLKSFILEQTTQRAPPYQCLHLCPKPRSWFRRRRHACPRSRPSDEAPRHPRCVPSDARGCRITQRRHPSCVGRVNTRRGQASAAETHTEPTPATPAGEGRGRQERNARLHQMTPHHFSR